MGPCLCGDPGCGRCFPQDKYDYDYQEEIKACSTCGCRQEQHDFDADFEDGRWRAMWGCCNMCGCQQYTEE